MSACRIGCRFAFLNDDHHCSKRVCVLPCVCLALVEAAIQFRLNKPALRIADVALEQDDPRVQRHQKEAAKAKPLVTKET